MSKSEVFEFGDQVKKFTGDYHATGRIVGVIHAAAGIRYAVEHEAEGGRFIHIYSARNIKMIQKATAEERRELLSQSIRAEAVARGIAAGHYDVPMDFDTPEAFPSFLYAKPETTYRDKPAHSPFAAPQPPITIGERIEWFFEDLGTWILNKWYSVRDAWGRK